MLRAGVDLIEIARIESALQRYGGRFLEHTFTEQERQEFGDNVASLAARFAAKEAVSKALGTGIGRVGWLDVEVLRGPARQPVLYLHGSAKQLADELGLTEWSLSLSHTATYAIAFVVACGGT